MKKLLLVDDDIALRKQFCFSLQRDYKVYEASNPKEAFEIIKSVNLDIALVDLGLGGYKNFNMQGGKDAAIRLQQQTDAKVGLFSAITNQEARQIARELGVPLFDKTKYDGFDNMLKETLHWNLNVHREHE